MNLFCIGDENTVLGFGLVGVEGRVVKTERQAREAFKVATSTPDVGIIIITERIAERLREEVNKSIYELNFPLVIEIPDMQGPLPERKSILQLVRTAVGVRI